MPRSPHNSQHNHGALSHDAREILTSNRRRIAVRSTAAPSFIQLYFPIHHLWHFLRPHMFVLMSLTLLASITYGALHWVTHSPRFTIKKFHVIGNEQVTKEKIRDILALEAETNIFDVSTADLEKQLEENPWILSAEIGRSLPDRLDIELKEQQALATIQLDHLYWVNQEGVPFKRASNLLDENLSQSPIITGISRNNYTTDPSKFNKEIQYALTAMHHYRKNTVRPRISEIHLNAQRSITFITYEEAIAIHLERPPPEDFPNRFRSFDLAWLSLDEEEHKAVRAFRIPNRTLSNQVTIAFSGN